MLGISSLIKLFAENYPIEKQQKYAGSEVTKVITKYGPEEIIDKLGINDKQFKVYGSVGNGGRSDIPWIAILDKDITSTTRNGYYVVILFDKKTQFINIGLGVGYTQFEEEYKQEANFYAETVYSHYANLLRDIPKEYTKGKIQLGATTPLGKGYESGQIVSINYQISDLTDEDVFKELRLMLGAYQELKLTVGSSILNLDFEIIESDNIVNEFKKEVAKKSLEIEVESAFNQLIDKANNESPKIRTRLKSEIVRNRKFAIYVKERVNYICEICGLLPFKQKNGNWYAEADHIEQLGGKTQGKDYPDNMRCLCAQCHSIITHGEQSEIDKLLKNKHR